MTAQDTIIGVATGASRGGIAVLRLSGSQALQAAEKLTQRSLVKPRYVLRVYLHSPRSGETLDDGVAIFFPGPNSYTGEDCVELHIHGGRPTVEAVKAALLETDLVRLAEPGEFTRRAFENGKMDLTQAEAVNDLIMADTEFQRQQALRQLGGGLSKIYDDWRDRLLSAQGLIEAEIDFSEEDLPEDMIEKARPILEAISNEIKQHLLDGRKGQQIRSGFKVVILGEPNVGKSSLMNVLSNEEVAIVSDIAGTTRDVLTVQMNLNGFVVSLYDTAGIRNTDDIIEGEGVRRALQKSDEADLRILMVDATDASAQLARFSEGQKRGAVIVLNKTDLAPEIPVGLFTANDNLDPRSVCAVSLKTGEGVSDLVGRLADIVADRLSGFEHAGITRERHRQALETAADYLDRFASDRNKDPALAAEDVRLAVRAVGRITGRVDIEDMLDIVFRDFCIGK